MSICHRRMPLWCAALGILGMLAGTPVVHAAVPDVANQIDRHLQAGEFGLAADVAAKAEPAAQRDLFLQIARAQAAAGEFQAAQQTARRASEAGRTQGRQGGGGGSGANPGPLINIIETQTGGPPDGPWLNQDGEGGTIEWFDAGVRVDPNGMLSALSVEEKTGRLEKLGYRARVASLNEEMARASGLRMVSLTRLERAVAERIRLGESIPESMRHLAGLSRIQYVFVYPESGDVVIAGPAEGWRYTASGATVGVSSERPTLQLDDLVTVLRTFAPQGMRIFGCSIDPRPEHLQAVKQYAETSKIGPAGRASWVKEIERRMGLQDIRIYGVPEDTRVARVLVEADYRMKLIGIDKLDAGRNIPSVFDIWAANGLKDADSLSALRWWLTMKYDAIVHSPDRDAFEIVGSSVRVMSEDEFLSSTGERVQTGKASATNQLFAANFTKNYAELAQRDPVFADLQNVFDLGMAAALCQTEGLAQRAGWDLGVFAPGGAYRVAVVPAMKTVHSVVNHRVYNGKEVVVQVAGGVRGDLFSVAANRGLRQMNVATSAVSAKAKAPALPTGRWWWDVAE